MILKLERVEVTMIHTVISYTNNAVLINKETVL